MWHGLWVQWQLPAARLGLGGEQRDVLQLQAEGEGLVQGEAGGSDAPPSLSSTPRPVVGSVESLLHAGVVDLREGGGEAITTSTAHAAHTGAALEALPTAMGTLRAYRGGGGELVYHCCTMAASEGEGAQGEGEGVPWLARLRLLPLLFP